MPSTTMTAFICWLLLCYVMRRAERSDCEIMACGLFKELSVLISVVIGVLRRNCDRRIQTKVRFSLHEAFK